MIEACFTASQMCRWTSKHHEAEKTHCGCCRMKGLVELDAQGSTGPKKTQKLAAKKVMDFARGADRERRRLMLIGRSKWTCIRNRYRRREICKLAPVKY